MFSVYQNWKRNVILGVLARQNTSTFDGLSVCFKILYNRLGGRGMLKRASNCSKRETIFNPKDKHLVCCSQRTCSWPARWREQRWSLQILVSPSRCRGTSRHGLVRDKVLTTWIYVKRFCVIKYQISTWSVWVCVSVHYGKTPEMSLLKARGITESLYQLNIKNKLEEGKEKTEPLYSFVHCRNAFWNSRYFSFM